MSFNSNSADLPTVISAYKPHILKIKINHFRSWIERRLTQLLEGLEDEILWSLVYNYLEEAQKRAKKEGPAANPTGGLKAEEIKTALSGFLGQKQAAKFVEELFRLLKEAEESETGIPAEFGLKPEEAVKEAFGIIEDKRKEMDMSQRVRREVSHNERYNRDSSRDHRYTERRDQRDRSEYHRSPSRSRSKRHSRSRSGSRGRLIDRRSEYYHENRRNEHHGDRSRYEPRDRSRERIVDRSDRDRGYYRDSGYSSRIHNRSRSRDRRDNTSGHYDRRRPDKSPIPSSSSSSASPSPCWESSLERSLPAAPRAPVANEYVPNALEQALRAKALKALSDKKQ